MTQQLNTSFSAKLPGLQIAVDSTSLGAYKTCPRYYQYSIVEGYVGREDSPHLGFGIELHEARQRYDQQRFAGASHEQALDLVLDAALRNTWDSELGRPVQWCMAGHKTKNRLSLIRTIVWYLDKLGRDDALQTRVLANGRPAVELSFRFDSGYVSPTTGESIQLCGHLDRIAALGGESYIVDIKTSVHDVRDRTFQDQFSPDNQMSIYALAGRVVFGQAVRELIIDGVQVGVGFSRFNRFMVPRSDESINEFLVDTGYWLWDMESAALARHWRMNEKSCGNYGGCPYRQVCGASPSARANRLTKDFRRRVWDPLQVRGDI